jgi:hypothetical protein
MSDHAADNSYYPSAFICRMIRSMVRAVLHSHSLAVKLAAALILLRAASFAESGGTRALVVQNKDAPSELIFACDRPTSELKDLFTAAMVADLRQLRAGVALSTEDLSTERAQVVRMLNSAGVPMTAWLVLPRDEGYYVNADDAAQTKARFEEFDKWTRASGLHWQAVGLDIEPSLADWTVLMGHKGRLFSFIVRRAFDSDRVRRAHDAYATLIKQMQASGYYVQTYQLEFLADERRAYSSVLQRILGIVDVRGNQEVLMLYTSFNHAIGAGIIWQYGPDAQAIAVGSTASSGDPATDAKFPPLNWDEFSRDLIVAHHFSSVVGVYSLEGCVRQGFITKLKTFDWNRPVVIPADSVSKAGGFRKFAFAVLWVASRGVYFFVAFLLGIALLARWFVRRHRRKHAGAIRGRAA